MSHPLDPVASGLVTALNALGEVLWDVESPVVTQRLNEIEKAIQAALGAVQREREADLEALERDR